VGLVFVVIAFACGSVACPHGGASHPVPPPPPPPPANYSPTVQLAAQSRGVPAGRTVALQATASDPDGDPLTYAWTATAGQVTPGPGGTASWTAPPRSVDAVITVSVSDGRGGVATAEVPITVLATSARPPPTANGHSEMPQFPWPPPAPTFSHALPRGLVVQADGETLKTAFDRMLAALRRGGFDVWSVYAIGDDGFAVAARMERINDDGTPRPGADRWMLRPSPREFSLTEFLKGLVTAQSGRYRVLVLLLTSRPVTFGPSPSPGDVMKLPAGGADSLPPDLAAKLVPPGRSSVALVYELFKRAPDDPARLVGMAESPLSPRAHLVSAGLWTPAELP
jgi:hypothetical protein